MDNFTINVQINVGVTPELCGILTALIGKQQPTTTAAVEAPEKKPRAKKIEAPVEQPVADPQPEAPVEQPAAAEDPQLDAEKKEYTEVDVRAAMDKTRRRIEGENYKEQTDSEGYKKWHRALTGWFKNTAAFCGADKPSALPDSKSRRKFIMRCDAVYVNDKGELTEDCTF